MLEHLESVWNEPDEGIWEVRGPRRHFTHSKVMAWTAMDRGVKAIEQFGKDGPVDRWRKLRDEIHAGMRKDSISGATHSCSTTAANRLTLVCS